MNEADRAAANDADEELGKLGLDDLTLELIEALWSQGREVAATTKLRCASGLSDEDAKDLLHRCFD